jgi:acetoin utilization deacetylase AcuC-like enzyme
MLKAPVRLGVVFFPAFDWAISPTHPEREERLLYTRDQLHEEGIFDIPGITEHRPQLAEYADVERVHFCLPDVESVCSASHLASAGGAVRAGRLVMDKEEERAFALVRPPGHHAMRVSHGNRGFCNVNIEAVMIEHLRSRYGPLRVAVVDTDCHHGDGTQDIFWNDPDTLFISLHQDGRTLYPGTGFLRESGGPAALGRTINFPLPPQTGDEGYLYVLEQAVLPLLADFKPDLIVNSAGQDNHFTDPLADMRLSARGYAELNRRLGPHVAVLEGGYAVRAALPYTNLAICLALAGLPFDDIREPRPAPPQNPRNADILKRLCEDALRLYHSPPSLPSEGREEGGFWIRDKDIFYDTDMLRERQKEAFRLCPDCPGFGVYETVSARAPLSLCIHIPRRACPECAEQARALARERHSRGYRRILVNDQSAH